MKGIQISGLGNITGSTSVGVQLAPFNVAVHAKGLQIGLVNYYKDKLDGFQLGLVNANPNTKVQMMIFGGNTTKLNMAARFKTNCSTPFLEGVHITSVSAISSPAHCSTVQVWNCLYTNNCSSAVI